MEPWAIVLLMGVMTVLGFSMGVWVGDVQATNKFRTIAMRMGVGKWVMTQDGDPVFVLMNPERE